jgi:hypothetical protein
MSPEDDAHRLRTRAMEIQSSDPRESLRLLMEVIHKYPDTLEVTNLVVSDIVSVCVNSRMWDEAIASCAIAQTIRPDSAEYYQLEADACRLMKEGREVQATELRLRHDTLSGQWFGTIREYGDKFHALGANDRAWQLYIDATRLAVSQQQSPHTVRESMARMLLDENKPATAVETLITGMCEASRWAKKGIPKSMIALLKRSLRLCRMTETPTFDAILDACKSDKHDQAISAFRLAKTTQAAL